MLKPFLLTAALFLAFEALSAQTLDTITSKNQKIDVRKIVSVKHNYATGKRTSSADILERELRRTNNNAGKAVLEGAWAFVKVQTVKPDGTVTTTLPKEGQAIFSNKHYSFCWTSHSSSTRSWQMSDAEKLDRFNQSIINTGTFELKDSILTTNATFGLNPMFSNGVAKFTCSFVGDTLILRGLSVYSSDNVAHPVYANGSYIVSTLVRKINQ